MSAERDPNYAFGAFEFDGDSLQLTRSGEPVALGRQPADILAYLLAHAGRLVRREELRDRVWGAEVNVDYEHSLNSCIRQIRAALGESADDPRFVQTFPRRGYKFIAAVQVDHCDSSAPEMSSGGEGQAGRRGKLPAMLRRRSAWLTLAIALAITVAVGIYGDWRPAAVPTTAADADAGTRVLAVLPFRSLTNAPADLRFSAELSADLAGRLQGIGAGELVVLATNASPRASGETASAAGEAAAMGAHLLLSGTVLRVGDNVRVTAQVQRLDDGTQVWASRHEGAFADDPGTRARIADQFVGAIRAALGVGDEAAGSGQRARVPQR